MMTMIPSALPASASATASVSLYDARPFFEKALQFGVQHRIIDQAKLDAICADAPKGMVQIARYFGNEFLRPDLEKAKDRLVNLVGLCLERSSGGDLHLAAELLRDHSFLSRSKGGADMLKALLAMPESTSFHESLDSEAELNGPPKGLADWSLKSLADYQAELARRLPVQLEKGAAVWLAAHLGMEAEALDEAHTHAEAVIRSALLALAAGRTELPDWVEFDQMVVALRKAHRAAKASSAVQGKAMLQSLSVTLPERLPDEFRDVVQAVRQSVLADLPQILDSPLSVRALFANDSETHHAPLLGRYFWAEDIASEMLHHEFAVSEAWDKATGGNCDDGSLLTLLVCVACGAAPRTSISEKAAAALVRKIQKPGAAVRFNSEMARQYLVEHAPAQHQDAYLELWDDFADEAQSALQSDSTYARKDALALLRRECHITA